MVFELYPNKQATRRPRYSLKTRFLLYFEDSVSGLVPGSPVEFRGIKLGEVLDVDVELDRETNEMRIPVVIEIEPERLGLSVAELDEGAGARIEGMVSRGFRARLLTKSILTGQKAVDFDFLEGAREQEVVYGRAYPILPTATGGLDAITTRVARIVDRVDQLPIESIGDDARARIAGRGPLAGRGLPPDHGRTTGRAPGRAAQRKERMTLRWTGIAILAVVISTTACLGRSPNPERYMLGTDGAGTAGDAAPEIALLVGPVRLPAYLGSRARARSSSTNSRAGSVVSRRTSCARCPSIWRVEPARSGSPRPPRKRRFPSTRASGCTWTTWSSTATRSGPGSAGRWSRLAIAGRRSSTWWRSGFRSQDAEIPRSLRPTTSPSRCSPKGSWPRCPTDRPRARRPGCLTPAGRRGNAGLHAPGAPQPVE